MSTTAYINRIATAVPANDIHDFFVGAGRSLLERSREQALFDRLAVRSQISHRFSVLAPAGEPEGVSIYARGRFPTTAQRMRLFEKHAPHLAVQAISRLGLTPEEGRISHLVVTSCTGMYAPGLDLDLVDRCGLDPSIERTLIGFMGCYAAINALKVARHIVRSAPESRVLVVNLELCTLHLQETNDIEQVLSFLVFGDGCAASVVSATIAPCD